MTTTDNNVHTYTSLQGEAQTWQTHELPAYCIRRISVITRLDTKTTTTYTLQYQCLAYHHTRYRNHYLCHTNTNLLVYHNRFRYGNLEV